MTSALGLTTYRWNNNIKSVLLLLAFPFLLLALVGLFFFLAALFNTQVNGTVFPPVVQALGLAGGNFTPVEFAKAGMLAYWPVMFGIAAAWVFVGALFNGVMIRAATGAKPIERREAPKLYNLLENLCIARGIKMPPLYVMETDGMNAFASGMSENSFAVTVTRGLLERLDDPELEAVLAHEMTHIMNRDVRLLVVAVVFTGMISFIAQMLWRSLRFTRSGDSRSGGRGNGALLLVLLAAVIAAVGYLVALVVRFALSRKREYLADAGSVELTKNPEALIGALEKISGNALLPHVPPEVRQMFIENPPSVFGLFNTHPPIKERIRILRELGNLPLPGNTIIPKAG